MQPFEKGSAGGSANAPAGNTAYAAPNTTAEQHFVQVLAGVVGAERVSVDSHFFDDLGADSMVMARFCARVRKHPDLPSVSMKEVYQHPTVRSLAAAVSMAPSAPAPAPVPVPAPTVPTPALTSQYVLCGVLQFISLLGYFFALAFILYRSYHVVDTGSGLSKLYFRALFAGGVQLLAMCTLPILLKWVLIGRWKPQQIRIWSLGYVRFWFVKILVQLNPVVMFAGTPIYALYLRALGAKIGRDAVIFSLHIPVCTDLLTIGDRAIVRKDAFFNCYRAQDGVIQTGPVTLGNDSFVGEMTVLDIDSSLGDGAQLGHSSSLHAGQSIPDGEHRCGSPARQRTDADFRAVEEVGCGILRKVAYSIAELTSVVVLLSLVMAVSVVLLRNLAEFPGVAALESGTLPNWTQLGELLVVSLVLFFGALLFGFAFTLTFPRLLNLSIKPDRVYRLYGFRYWAHRTIERVTNNPIFLRIFGDSSYIVHYLSWLGYDLKPVVQTGSNFGTTLKHNTPYLVTVGGGTMIADGLSVINAEYSSTSFRVSRVSIGRDNFLGNFVAYPSGGKTGENCLLASKVMVPVDGQAREGIGLLGSPAFEIPRTVYRDSELQVTGEEVRRRLSAKNKHNLVTIGLFLLMQWGLSLGYIAVAGAATAARSSVGEELAITISFVLAILFRTFYFVLVEHAARKFRPLQPQSCSIYDPYFWFHERYWKLMTPATGIKILDGTPLKGIIWRLLGVRVGKRLFDDGGYIVESTLVTVGDDCTFNVGSTIQPHSQEDGGFKSDRIKLGAHCTVGVFALVHYGVTLGDGVLLGPNTFVMKGEEVPPNARWEENPAREVREIPSAQAAIATAGPVLPAPGCGHTTLKGGQPA